MVFRFQTSLWSGLVMVGLMCIACGCKQSTETSSNQPGSAGSSVAPRSSAPESSTPQVETGPKGEGWGSLVVSFQYGGDPPEQELVLVDRDPEFCGPLKPLIETVIVNPENKGIANVVMWLSLKPTDDLPPIHPSYDATAETELKLDNHNCSFLPHVILKRTTQPLVIGNSDEVGHNSKGEPRSNTAFNTTVSPHTEVTINPPLNSPERTPFAIECSFHTWMRSFMLVQAHPYMAVSDENGQLRIENLPTGTWEFVVWHEKPGYVTEVTQDGAAQQWSRGKVVVTIEPDQETDLGAVVIAPGVLGY